MLRRSLALLASLVLVLPAVTMAQDPSPAPSAPPLASVCDVVETIDGGATVVVDAWTAEDGQCAIASGSQLPAWAWLDADITVYCQAPTGSGTSQVKDGFYMRGTTRDQNNDVVNIGNVTNWVGCSPTGTRSVVHKQLVMQGYDRTITLVFEKRAWPFSGTKIVSADMTRQYSGTVWVH